MTYITWELYSSLFHKIPQESFARMALKASMKMDALTHGRVQKFISEYDDDTVTGFQKNVKAQIEMTCAELAEAMYMQENSAIGTGITSVGNDGYSESYKVVTHSEKECELQSIVIRGLSGSGLAGAL